MHSSFLRGTDFRITHQRENVSHGPFFHNLTTTDRVGVFAPDGIDGLGACLLLLAHTTAFYDCYRESGKEFFAYPDYFTFQRHNATASYSMFDIWPGHKDVSISDDPGEAVNEILDRAINILVVPARTTKTAKFSPVQIARAERTIRRCYTYTATGVAENSTLSVACVRPEPAEWAHSVVNTAPPNNSAVRKHWLRVVEKNAIPEQSFSEITLDQALNFI